MNYRALSLAALLLLAGCQTHTRMLEQDGAITAEPSNVAGSDFVVKIRNLLDFGFNPDDKANRSEWALRYLQTQCPNGRIVNERTIETGTYGFGRPSRTYFIYVACK